MPVKTVWLFTLLAVLVVPAVAQDVVQLKNGDRLAGKVTDGLLVVRLDTPAGEVSLRWSRIEKIDRAKFVRELYQERSGKLERGDAQSHYLLALWCRRQGLGEEMRQELQKTLEIDPENQAARSALGFEKVDDKWVEVVTDQPAIDPQPIAPGHRVTPHPSRRSPACGLCHVRHGRRRLP